MLAINKVTKCFDGLKVLDDLSLTLVEGTVTGLLGPNGAGKTTLLRSTSLCRPNSWCLTNRSQA